MATLKDILAYILRSHPGDEALSNGRATKIVYLSDWKHVLEEGTQLSNIRWKFDNFGPFVWEVLDTAREHPELFVVKETENFFGSPKKAIACVDSSYRPRLSESEKRAIDHVINTTHRLGWEEFIGLVYSTYPIVVSERYSYLDLPRLATQYKDSPVYKKVQPA